MTNQRYLLINFFIWFPYGILCLIQPGFLADVAGVSASTATGTIELRAMYGGAQAAIGALCFMASRRPDLERAGLVSVAFIASGLFLGRLTGTVVGADVSGYTAGTLGFELTLAASSLWLLSKTESAAA